MARIDKPAYRKQSKMYCNTQEKLWIYVKKVKYCNRDTLLIIESYAVQRK